MAENTTKRTVLDEKTIIDLLLAPETDFHRSIHESIDEQYAAERKKKEALSDKEWEESGNHHHGPDFFEKL